MAFDSVPWFIGGEAEHSAEAARNQTWIATQGATGVVQPRDMRVTATSTPSGSVNIAPGGAVIESTYQGASQQSYTIRNPTQTSVSIPANNTSGTARRYVWAQVTDPQYEGAQPSDVALGPYTRPVVTTSATPPGSHPAVLLAEIRMGANTATVTQSMIYDAREVANPRRRELTIPIPTINQHISGWSHTLRHKFDEGGLRGEKFPDQPNDIVVPTPDWATSVIYETQLTAIRYTGQSSWGAFWLNYGPVSGQREKYNTQNFGWDALEGGVVYGGNWLMSEHRQLPADCRGTDMNVTIRAAISTDAGAKRAAVSMTSSSGILLRMTFLEDAEPISYNNVVGAHWGARPGTVWGG